ncbi:ABC transporter substrate-binding protein [Streptomyces alfalfae]|uniref:Sugar ABC transporter substrate-binding protein n=2 Tax=Streptomyces alfalfae TaxID=1642299 RepID=A0ABM6H0R7_9ACTN|nr:ABC transporter substrate-binding protein [Streptomyces alfalfae]AYA20327.1 ABC transporter substrate-binding protein [Streptomyces fradiae]APY89872.1 sugar ABC transporter substrate-binding protein [Streptomyces alfalfae]QUI30066.1 ABC transporter substrate-binding protein [Streptomyces alfalfae]RXX42692.1 ABC transporter substrate-binding protein [Streptomyces alfalfae]RZM83113.1 ABC transporter substrate-binding protein [Streptomyces alfalfae]
MTAVPEAPGPLSRRGVLRAGGVGALAAAGGALSGCAAGTADGVGSDGRVTIQMWHGQTDTAAKVLKSLAAEFERTHPGIRVDMGGGVLADAMLQKITAALASGAYPDIAYVFGSDLASVARSPQVVDLTEQVRRGPTPWRNYHAPARDAVTVNGRVRAVPALLDALAVVCNKKVFAEAGVDLPEAGWTWREFTDTARRLTDAAAGRFGTGWPGTGDEDTVWRLWPLVWDLGGDVIAEDGRSIGFEKQGARALEVVQDLVRDKSLYIDPKPGSEQLYQVFLSGRMAMVPTAPWQLPDIQQAEIDYHVVPLPSFSRRPITISGPDTWTLFDNGGARVEAARAFVTWLTQPAQDSRWDVEAGSLPLSRRSEDRPAWREHSTRTPGLSVFTEAVTSARVRPVHPAYPRISRALGQAIVAVLLGRESPADAVRRCAEESNAALLIPR